MKKTLPPDFQNRLWTAIKAIEQHSQVEVVVVLRSRSADYHDIHLSWGLLGGWLGLTYSIFAPTLFSDLWVYSLPIGGFMLAYLLAHIPALTRLSAGKRRLNKQVEIMARAVFQKGGIQHTQAKIGVLVYCSWLERRVYLLPDQGAAQALPAAVWHTLDAGLQNAMTSPKPLEALLAELAKAQPIFQRYLPPQANDINELPDLMEIDL